MGLLLSIALDMIQQLHASLISSDLRADLLIIVLGQNYRAKNENFKMRVFFTSNLYQTLS